MGLRVLVTRPEPDAAATAARLRAAGHEPLVDPLLRILPIAEARLSDGRFDAVALTSVNGARALAVRPELDALCGLPLHAVGRRTAAAAPAAFGQVHVAGGDGEKLAFALRAALPRGSRLLHVAGEDRAIDLAAALAPDGIAVALFVIYRASLTEALAVPTREALAQGRIDAALHFSPRTAGALVAGARLAGLVPALARIDHLCFSAGVAAPLRAAGAPARVAAAPNEEALLALLRDG
ncbi:MAG TPA: uroporphyrinogen-III synthase [Xanthobacteraceae bacterium]|nr:uroporphyrinogen-III synthase [Xanthobacteraceae bacterium]